MQINDNVIDSFARYANTIPESRYATNAFDTNLEQQTIMFACYGGRTSRRINNILYSIGVLCDITEMAAITSEPIDEKESMAAGKMKWKSNRGQKMTTSLTFNGDAIHGIAAIIGYDFSNEVDSTYKNLAPNTMRIKGDYGILGNLFILGGSIQRNLRSSTVLTQCRLIINEAVGTNETFTVNIESEGEFMKTANGQMVVFENFIDKGDGLIINPFAPDGLETVFKVGNGNESLIGAALTGGLPLQPVRPHRKPMGVASEDVTDPFYWFVEIAIDGVPQTPEDVVSFDRVSGELTLAAAPAEMSCLSLTYTLPTGYPDYNEKMQYYEGDSRYYNGDLYQCTTQPTGIGAFNPTDWTLVPASTHLTGKNYRPHNFGQGVGTIYNPSYPTCMFWTWTIKNLYM
jgi:hypothetical protein